MNVLLIHQAFVGPNEAGGTRHFELARHCLEAGNTFSVVASDLSYLTGQRTAKGRGLIVRENLGGLRILRAYTLPTIHKSFIWRVISFLSFMVTSIIAGLRSGPVDLVMGTTPPIFQAASAWVIAFVRRRPFLLEVRDLWPEFAIDMGVLKNPVLIRLSRWLERFLYARAECIVVNSPAYRDYLIEHGIAPERIEFVPNGVNPGMFHPSANGNSIRDEFGLDSKFVVTYAGAIGMANDISTVLRAARSLQGESGIRFLIVGDGKERNACEEIAKEWGLNNVVFSGARPKSEMPVFLAASNVCLATLKDIPMFKTTYPNKVFDYMAAGRPTILAIDGVIRDVIEEANAGIFVAPGDDVALSAAVMKLFKAPAIVTEMGNAARRFVTEHFDRAAQAEEFLGVLERVANSRARRVARRPATVPGAGD